MTTHLPRWLAATALALSLAGCGDSSELPPPAAPAASDAIPDSASASAEGMVGYLAKLATEDAEAKQALDVAKFMPPAAEDAQPLALN